MKGEFIVERVGKTTRYLFIAEDGEIIYDRTEDDYKQAEINGFVDADVFGRLRVEKKTDGNTLYTFSVDGEIVMSGWQKPPKRRAGDKNRYYRVHENLAKLTDEQRLALDKLEPYLRIGGLIGSRKRTKQGRKDELLQRFSVGKNKAYKLFNELEDAGVVYEKDDKFYISGKYIHRG